VALIENPKEYDNKESTNLRLSAFVKDRLKKEAEERGLHMTDIINELLEERYSKKGD
jgi:predicted DNA binding CopG/RHH family protein